MNHSEMGDLQDAIALSGMVPQSCVPTFGELEEWTAETVADVRRWLAEGYWSDRTPDVFIAKIAAYHSPGRNPYGNNPNLQTRHDVEDMRDMLAYRHGR